MIKIYVNDEIFNESITLTSKKKEVIIPNGEGKLRLKIVALNNGKSGINTVNFELNNSYNVKGFSSILNKGESFHLEFKKKWKLFWDFVLVAFLVELMKRKTKIIFY